ncbi:MAG: DUF5317 family protein [bacterium]|nr:DUF5317 family protein [bacterium]
MISLIILTVFITLLFAVFRSGAIDVFSNERLAFFKRRGPVLILFAITFLSMPLKILVEKQLVFSPSISHIIAKALVIAMPISAFCIFVGVNKRFWGYAYGLSAGNILNAVAMFANDWHMPVDTDVARSIGMWDVESGLHSAMTPSTRLPFLCDRFFNPHFVDAIFSIGDALLFVGFAITAIQLYIVLSPYANQRP